MSSYPANEHSPSAASSGLGDSPPRGVSSSLLTCRYLPLLISYFSSGWAFLLPYLAGYLVYGWMKWPVNPVGEGQWTVMPCLLHVYWALHAIHLPLGVIMLRFWWKKSKLDLQNTASTDALCASTSSHTPLATCERPPSSAHRSLPTVLWSVAPWFCLALIFWIPGAFLEFPADPWSHFARINEWHAHTYIAEHSARHKASYFLAYSLFGFLRDVSLELVALDLFHAGVCTLLSWQYYRLARTTGLQTAYSMVAAILGVVFLGNNIFGFYRYYGISSSAIAQIAFVAGTRHLLTLAKHWIGTSTDKTYALAFLKTATAFGATGIVAAMNHLQAIAFIALLTGAIVIWAMVTKFGKEVFIMITALAVFGSLGSLMVYERGVSSSRLSDWGGFALLSAESATHRTMEIFGTVGLMNLIAGMLLLRRNHVVGWLTVFPALALATPMFALPLAHELQVVSSIEMFNRMLLAIPLPLALVCLSNGWCRQPGCAPAGTAAQSVMAPHWELAYPLTLLVLAFLTTAPASYPNFNRFFNSLEQSNIGTGWQTFPAEVREALGSLPREQPMFGPPNARFASDSFGLTALLHTSRDFVASRHVEETARTIPHVYDFNPAAGLLLVCPTAATVPTSYAGYLSRHWPPQALAYDSAGYTELRRLAEAQRLAPVGEGAVQLFLAAPR